MTDRESYVRLRLLVDIKLKIAPFFEKVKRWLIG
jgi:hypothetical protein